MTPVRTILSVRKDTSGVRVYKSRPAGNFGPVFMFVEGVDSVGDQKEIHFNHLNSVKAGQLISLTSEVFVGGSFSTEWQWSRTGKDDFSGWADISTFNLGSWANDSEPLFIQLRFTLDSISPGGQININEISIQVEPWTLLFKDARPVQMNKGWIAEELEQLFQGAIGCIMPKVKQTIKDPDAIPAGPGSGMIEVDVDGFQLHIGHPDKCTPNQSKPSLFLWDIRLGAEELRNSCVYERTVEFEAGIKFKCGDRQSEWLFKRGRELLQNWWGIHSNRILLWGFDFGPTEVNGDTPYKLGAVTMGMLGIQEPRLLGQSEYEDKECGCLQWRGRFAFRLVNNYIRGNF